MRLNNEQAKVVKTRLKLLGWIDQNSDDFNYYLSKKHVSRYEELIIWMRSRKLSLTEVNVNNCYKADVVVRSKISTILKPIELEIVQIFYMC